MRSLSVQELKRAGLLEPGASRPWEWWYDGRRTARIFVTCLGDRLLLTFTHEPNDEIVRLATTPCNYGGVRYWFICRRCRLRAGKIYWGRVLFACRKCFDLAYPTQRMSPHYRTLAKARRLYERLGKDPGSSNNVISKPKGMHWQTFHRLHLQALQADVAFLGAGLESLRRFAR